MRRPIRVWAASRCRILGECVVQLLGCVWHWENRQTNNRGEHRRRCNGFQEWHLGGLSRWQGMLVTLEASPHTREVSLELWLAWAQKIHQHKGEDVYDFMFRHFNSMLQRSSLTSAAVSIQRGLRGRSARCDATLLLSDCPQGANEWSCEAKGAPRGPGHVQNAGRSSNQHPGSPGVMHCSVHHLTLLFPAW